MTWLCVLAASAVAALVAPSTSAPSTSTPSHSLGQASLRVMSFNIRYDNASDGPKRWDQRKELLVETIRRFSPDLLGAQEVLSHQGEYLRAQLKDYGFVGVGREDGKLKGEFAPIFYRTDRFELIDSGTYWLSETPTKIGSVGWDADLTRIMTWAKLRDRHAGGQLLVVNTHFDHKGERARLESAKLVRRKIGELCGGPTIVTGDFNCTENDPPYAALVTPDLADAYRDVHPKPEPDAASFHGFHGGNEGDRIDWILHSPTFETIEASIDRAARDGHYPSDHYPVCATLRPAARS